MKKKIKTIFLILTGEDEVKRPRSKKLLEIIKKSNLNENEYLIVISGLSGFKLDVTSASCERLQTFLIQKGVPIQNMVLEKESLDTLGNMVFSYDIIERIIIENPTPNTKIVLITEGFHLHRSKKLFLKIFSNLQRINPEIKFEFKAANTLGISSFYWKRKVLSIIEKIKRHLEVEKNLFELFKRVELLSFKYVKDFLILDMILTDFDIYRIKTLEDIRNYLYSLPVYNQKYKAKKKYPLRFSFYVKAINYELEKREENS